MIRRIALPAVAVDALLHRVNMRVRVGIEVGDVLSVPEFVSPVAQHVNLVRGRRPRPGIPATRVRRPACLLFKVISQPVRIEAGDVVLRCYRSGDNGLSQIAATVVEQLRVTRRIGVDVLVPRAIRTRFVFPDVHAFHERRSLSRMVAVVEDAAVVVLQVVVLIMRKTIGVLFEAVGKVMSGCRDNNKSNKRHSQRNQRSQRDPTHGK